MAVSRMVGARVRRKEDPRLITGAGTYVDDVRRVHERATRYSRRRISELQSQR